MVTLSKSESLNAVDVYGFRVSNISFPSVDLRDGHRQIATALLSVRNQQMRNLHVPLPVNSSLPWECESSVSWCDLGLLYFPRYISDVVCLENNCWYGHCSCRPVMQIIKVLKLNKDNSRDMMLPPVLRPRWVLADVETSVFCQCSR